METRPVYNYVLKTSPKVVVGDIDMKSLISPTSVAAYRRERMGQDGTVHQLYDAGVLE